MDDKDKQKNQSYSMANKYYHGTKAQESQTKPKKKKASVKKALITATCLTLAGTGLFFGGKAIYEKIKESQTPPDPSITEGQLGKEPPSNKLPQKNTPLNLNELSFIKEANTVSWNECEGASYYRVNVNGNVFTTKQNSVVLDLGTEQDFEIYVQAVGDGTYYINSDILHIESRTAPENYPTCKKVSDNFKEIIEELNAKRNIKVLEIYNIEVNEDNVTAQFACRIGNNSRCNFTSIAIVLENYVVKNKSLQTLLEISEHLKQQEALSFDMEDGYRVGDDHEPNFNALKEFSDAVLNVKLNKEKVFGGELPQLISEGYTLIPLFTSYKGIARGLTVYTAFRATKDADEKFVVIDGTIMGKDKQESQGRNYYKEFLNGDYRSASFETHVYDSIPEYTSIYDKSCKKTELRGEIDGNSVNEKKFFGDLEETVVNAQSFYIEGKNKSLYKFSFPEAEQSM